MAVKEEASNICCRGSLENFEQESTMIRFEYYRPLVVALCRQYQPFCVKSRAVNVLDHVLSVNIY